MCCENSKHKILAWNTWDYLFWWITRFHNLKLVLFSCLRDFRKHLSTAGNFLWTLQCGFYPRLSAFFYFILFIFMSGKRLSFKSYVSYVGTKERSHGLRSAHKDGLGTSTTFFQGKNWGEKKMLGVLDKIQHQSSWIFLLSRKNAGTRVVSKRKVFEKSSLSQILKR